MNFNYTLKYRTFDKLLADVQMDLASYDLQGQIDPSQLIKVAMRVNYDLGLRIQQPKDDILEVEHGKTRLPDDFTVMNYAMICGEPDNESIVPPQGTHTESLNPNDSNHPDNISAVVPKYTPFPDSKNCGCPNNQKVCLEWNKEQPIVIQKVNTVRANNYRRYSNFYQIRFTNSHFVSAQCPNIAVHSNNPKSHKYDTHNNGNSQGYNGHGGAINEAFIKDGFIWTSMGSGNLYINYEGAMEDSDGNLLVPNHPLLNEYYEYALKQRIFENLVMAGESLGPQIQIVEQRFRAARNNALSMVNTPNFSEMQKLWVANRLAQYSKYYDMFKSYAGQMSPRVNNAV